MPVPDLHDRLGELDSLVDPAHARDCERLFEDAFSYRGVDHLPRQDPSPVDGWPTYPYSEAFYGVEKMLINELAGVYQGAKLRDDRVYTIRANYGVGTIASMFGCKTSLTMNNMPWCEPLSDAELLEALDMGVPDMNSGLGDRVLETERFYVEMLSKYPNLKEAVHIFVCDTQGPFDVTHLIIGHRIYTDIYDRPEIVHRALDLAVETGIRFTKAQKEITGEGCDWHFHSQMKARGGVRIYEDTPTNISPAAYLEFCRPYNERFLAELGGGWIHYCGAGHQIFPHVISTPGLSGINFGNPDMQDLRAIYDAASSRGVGVLAWSRPLSPENAEHMKTGISIIAERK
ncbi:MAG: hypothetical protein NTU88_14805 [Armatimonadetes bacterium]|nr:hypothetical protein [Armatimonadota bacterium]